MFSVLMSVYKNDNPIFFKRALESIYENKNLKPSEIVVVKDGPVSIELEMVLAQWESKNSSSVNIKIIGLKENVGLGEALRIGLTHCSHKLVARMDADDISMPDRFELQYQFLLLNPKVSLVGGSIEEFVHEGNKPLCKRVPPRNADIMKYAKFRNPVNHVTVMFRKEDIVSVGSYMTMHGFEDYFLWVRLLKNGYSIANIFNVLVRVRLGENFNARRSGFLYIKREVKFLFQIYKIGFLTKFNLFKMLSTRMPLRILPPFALSAVYRLARKR